MNRERAKAYKATIGEFKESEIKKFQRNRLKKMDIDGQGLDPSQLASAQFVKNVYKAIEENYETKKNYSEKDWMNKNTNEKPQSFDQFKSQVRNWDINECIILEMWDQQEDEAMRKREKNF